MEDGNGTITYKDGRTETVVYYAGKKADQKPLRLAPGEYAALKGKDPNCRDGNCRNGYGTYVYESGNIYTGNFKEFAREGKGVFYFTNGSMFNGNWQNNMMTQGTYTYATGAQYSGTYDASGNELNGTVTAGSRRVEITNGRAVIVKQELYGYQTAADLQREAKMKEWAKKPKVNYTPWGFPEKSAIEKDKESFEKMMRESDARDRYYNAKWGG